MASFVQTPLFVTHHAKHMRYPVLGAWILLGVKNQICVFPEEETIMMSFVQFIVREIVQKTS
jgi:hypothetical protein